MTIFTDGLRMQQAAPDIDELGATLGEGLAATAADAWNQNPMAGISRLTELNAAKGARQQTGYDPMGNPTGVPDEAASALDIPPPPTVPMAEAKQRVKSAGLDSVLHLGDEPEISAPALDIMMNRAQQKRERDVTIERGIKGFVPNVLSVGTSFLVGAVDPLNIASAFIPVVGELRYAKLMASAGEGAIARAGARAGVGAASGTVGILPTIPLEYAARTQEGQDYTMAEALHTVLFGAALGGALHSGGGAVADVLRRRKGQAVYPFAEGEIFGPAAEPLTPPAAGRPGESGPIGDFGIPESPRGARAVYDDILTQLKTSGMPDDQAQTNAAVVASRYATRAERLGLEPDEAFVLYKNEGIDVRRVEDGSGELGVEGERQFAQSPTATTFYSAVDNAISTSKQEKASPDQWLGTIRNTPGVKAEELEWLGLESWLKEQKGPVTKSQVSDYVRANQIEVKEVEKGGEAGTKEKAFELAREHGWKSWDEIDTKSQQRYMQRASREAGEVPTKFHTYQLPGGENYRELLLTLPTALDATKLPVGFTVDKGMFLYEVNGPGDGRYASGKTPDEAIANFHKLHPAVESFKSSHWDEPNVLAHIRFNDRTINGKKTLFIEEVQSDWHQKGKREGYSSEENAGWTATRQEFAPGVKGWSVMDGRGRHVADVSAETAEAAIDSVRGQNGRKGTVPDAPFKTTWPELSMKRMIRYAAENGYDQIAWTPGEVQAARYDLSKQVDALVVHRRDDGTFDIDGVPVGGVGADPVAHRVAEAKLADTVGKDLARKIVDDLKKPGEKEYHGVDLKVGGEGMLGFYDDILPATVNKLVKKFGTKVEIKNRLEDAPKGPFEVKEAGDNGRGEPLYKVVDGSGNTVFDNFKSIESAQHNVFALEHAREKREPMHAVDLTQKLKASAIERGFPLFQGAAEGAPRGRITLDNNKAVIELFDKANPSTFMHEAGHLWLDELVRDAAHAKASGALKEDMATTLRWLGVERPEDIKIEQHEQWARGFEQYLASGEAPSPQLKSAFEKFKDWLLTIYRSLSELGRPIPDDIRGVMDRLIASDREMAMREMSPEMRAIADLPPEAQRDIMRSGIASLIKGEPVRAGEILSAAAKSDPRIAESLGLMDPGATPRAAGALDTTPSALRAVDESEWKSLAAERRDYNEPELLDASRAAEQLPEPPSLIVNPGKRLQAAEKSAQEAEQLFAASEPYLDPQLVQKVRDDIAKLDQESADTQVTLKRGAACLASAFVGTVR